MPELPDVEFFRRRLSRGALGKRIEAVDLRAPRMLEGATRARLESVLEGNRLVASRRHGKHLLVRLEHDGWLALHFGLTGGLEVLRPADDEPGHTRMMIGFADGTRLAYTCTRMFGRIALTATPARFIAEHELGPDVLDRRFDQRSFERIRALGKPVKAALMDQALMAGIGNIFSDEILFAARVHPLARCDELTDKQVRAIHRCMRSVLEAAIRYRAGSAQFVERLPERYLIHSREPGGRCPRCRARLKSFRLASRTGYFCPRCQPKGGKA